MINCIFSGFVSEMEKIAKKEKLISRPMDRLKGSGIGRGSGMAMVFGNKKNAPMFAYEVAYDKKSPWIPGFDPTEKKRTWKGMPVDYSLKNEWLNDLNKILNIQIRSTCEGHGKGKPTFIGFTLLKDTSSGKYSKKIERELKKKGFKAKAETGNLGFRRIMMAKETDPKKKDWEKWWNNAVFAIKESVEKVLEKKK